MKAGPFLLGPRTRSFFWSILRRAARAAKFAAPWRGPTIKRDGLILAREPGALQEMAACSRIRLVSSPCPISPPISIGRYDLNMQAVPSPDRRCPEIEPIVSSRNSQRSPKNRVPDTFQLDANLPFLAF